MLEILTLHQDVIWIFHCHITGLYLQSIVQFSRIPYKFLLPGNLLRNKLLSGSEFKNYQFLSLYSMNFDQLLSHSRAISQNRFLFNKLALMSGFNGWMKISPILQGSEANCLELRTLP